MNQSNNQAKKIRIFLFIIAILLIGTAGVLFYSINTFNNNVAFPNNIFTLKSNNTFDLLKNTANNTIYLPNQPIVSSVFPVVSLVLVLVALLFNFSKRTRTRRRAWPLIVSMILLGLTSVFFAMSILGNQKIDGVLTIKKMDFFLNPKDRIVSVVGNTLQPLSDTLVSSLKNYFIMSTLAPAAAIAIVITLEITAIVLIKKQKYDN